MDHGNFPYTGHNYYKVLGEDYNVDSKDFHDNVDAMTSLNRELDYHVENTLSISLKEQEKMLKKGKFSPMERINRMLDRGSPFLEIGQLAGHDAGELNVW